MGGASTSTEVQHRHDSPPNFRTLHRSLQQRVGAVGYHHVLHRRLTWEDFTNDVDNRFTSGRTEPLNRSVRFTKPIYSSFVNLLDISLSDTSFSSHNSNHSDNSPAPLQGVLDLLGINQIDCNNIEVENNDTIVTQVPALAEEDNISEHSLASATMVDIDDIIEDNIRNEQLLIDFGCPRLIDNPRDVWWVSDIPPSPNQLRSETTSEESLTSTERRRRQE